LDCEDLDFCHFKLHFPFVLLRKYKIHHIKNQKQGSMGLEDEHGLGREILCGGAEYSIGIDYKGEKEDIICITLESSLGPARVGS
jgi:hypothetical protein